MLDAHTAESGHTRPYMAIFWLYMSQACPPLPPMESPPCGLGWRVCRIFFYRQFQKRKAQKLRIYIVLFRGHLQIIIWKPKALEISEDFKGKQDIARGRLKKWSATFRLRRRKSIEGRALQKNKQKQRKKDMRTKTRLRCWFCAKRSSEDEPETS